MPDSAPLPGQAADGAPTRRSQPAFAATGEGSRSVPDVVAAVCPFLVASDGTWRAAVASREHRCGATDPPGRLPLDRQQSLCLAVAHLDCPLFEAATGPTGGPQLQRAVRAAAELDPNSVPATHGETSREAGSGAVDAPAFVQASRANPRTTPVIIDRARSPLDVHLPQIRLPAMPSRRPAPGAGETAATDATVNRTRLEQLRDARMRARAQAEFPPAADGSPPVERPADQGSVDPSELSSPLDGAHGAPSAGAATRPSWSSRLPRPGASPARLAGSPGSVLRRSAPAGVGVGVGLGGSGGAGGSGRFRTLGGAGGSGRFRTPGGAGGSRGSMTRIRAAVAGREIQAALAGFMALALVLVLIVRFSTGGGAAGVAGASSSVRPSVAPTAAQSAGIPSAAASAGATGSAAASVEPSTSPEPSGSIAPATSSASAKPTPKPTSSAAAARTYKVKSGDTLSAIAARFKTTVAVLMHLNNITDPKSLRIGQVLKLP